MTLLPAILLSISLVGQTPRPLADEPSGGAKPDVAVVCPAMFEPALAPWLAFRREQGHTIALLRAEQTPEAIREQLRELAAEGALRFVLLVGDADPRLYTDADVRARCVPAQYVAAKINVKWGSEAHLATDNYYADLDGDTLPDLAVGRLTADTPEELSLMVRKILAYEQDAGFGAWRRRVNFVAGVGGFGKLADAVLESTTRALIAGGLPTAYESSMTYASWQSPYCPHPHSFRDATLARLNEGCLFWVYIGHGHYRTLDHLRGPDGEHRILTAEDMAQLRCETGQPIAFFMACYTGAYDAAQDCLAEEMLRAPGGPVAIFSGSRVTMPYAMAVLGTELIQQCFTHQAATLGEAILHAKRAMLIDPAAEQVNPARTNQTPIPNATATSDGAPSAEQDRAGVTRRTLDMLAQVISPAPDELAAERREHVQMFNLFGDPLLRLRHGTALRIQVPESALAGQRLDISGHAPLGGRCVVDLVAPRGALTCRPPNRASYSTTQQAIALQNTEYDRANDRRWATQSVRLEPGPFRVSLAVPPEAQGQGHICVFLEGERDFALGSADLSIRQPMNR